MRAIQHLLAKDAILRPWRNGRGETAEIAVWPIGADVVRGDFTWRLSRAAVVEDGAFSAFPGFDRTLVLLDGDGLVIEHGDSSASRTLRPLVPYEFSGDWPTRATLIGSSVRDLNVIVARGRARSSVRVVRDFSQAVAVDAEHVLLHVVHGRVRATCDGGRDLLPHDTLWLHGQERDEPLVFDRADPRAVAILVAIETS